MTTLLYISLVLGSMALVCFFYLIYLISKIKKEELEDPKKQ